MCRPEGRLTVQIQSQWLQHFDLASRDRDSLTDLSYMSLEQQSLAHSGLVSTAAEEQDLSGFDGIRANYLPQQQQQAAAGGKEAGVGAPPSEQGSPAQRLPMLAVLVGGRPPRGPGAQAKDARLQSLQQSPAASSTGPASAGSEALASEFNFRGGNIARSATAPEMALRHRQPSGIARLRSEGLGANERLTAQATPGGGRDARKSPALLSRGQPPEQWSPVDVDEVRACLLCCRPPPASWGRDFGWAVLISW